MEKALGGLSRMLEAGGGVPTATPLAGPQATEEPRTYPDDTAR